MKLGYVGNASPSTGCRPDKYFRLSSYNEERLISTVDSNLKCIKSTLEYNLENNLLFYRIADFIPFASHPICDFDWQNYFKTQFKELGSFIKNNNIRITMHPGQYTVINSNDEKTVEKSINELTYNVTVLDAMGLDRSAKVQIHVGGVYGNKYKAIKNFIQNFNTLPINIQARLVIENDDVSYDLQDCLKIHKETGIPVVFDIFHHSIKNQGETVVEGIKLAQKTWNSNDGILMIDWSSQEPNMKTGKHASSLDTSAFTKFIMKLNRVDCDIMLEIKDKERSALKAIEIINNTRRIYSAN